MDLLLSVPVASYFLAPTSSLSASVNLLFFYLTWSTLVLSHPPLAVHLVGLVAIRTLLGLLPGLLSLLLDTGLPSVAASFKYGGRSAIPPRDARSFAWAVGVAVLNVLWLAAVEGVCSLLFTLLLGRPEFKTSTTLPLPWSMAKHIIIMLAGRELLLYYIHKHVLHGRPSSNNSLYSVARAHALWAHARPGAPFTLQLFGDHPFPLLLHRFLPIYLPALALRPHLLTYLLFVALCTAEEATSMSGYSVVPGIVMGGMTQRSAIHYATGGEANFGAWGLLDWVHGTGQGRGVLDDVKAEAEKHAVKERTSRKASQGANAVQNAVETWKNGADSDSTTPPRKSGRKKTSKKNKSE